MTTTSRDPREKNDELDLIEFLRKIIFFIKTYSKLIIMLSVLGIIAGGLTYLTIPKSYSSTMFLEPVTLNKQQNFQIVNNWAELLRRGDHDALAEKFKCNKEVLDKVNSITAEEIPKANPQISTGFIVRVSVRDTVSLNKLQQAILNGFENNEYVVERLISKRQNLNQLVAKVGFELQKLDSLKTSIEAGAFKAQKGAASFMLDISQINSQIIGLMEKKVAYIEELKFTEAVHVLQSFQRFGKPDQPKLRAFLVLGLSCGLIIGLLASFYKIFLRKYPGLL